MIVYKVPEGIYKISAIIGENKNLITRAHFQTPTASYTHIYVRITQVQEDFSPYFVHITPRFDITYDYVVANYEIENLKFSLTLDRTH